MCATGTASPSPAPTTARCCCSPTGSVATSTCGGSSPRSWPAPAGWRCSTSSARAAPTRRTGPPSGTRPWTATRPTWPRSAASSTAAHYHPASLDEVGGDFYDLFRPPDSRWGFFLGDVCGKGAPAAALTSLTRYGVLDTRGDRCTISLASGGHPPPVLLGGDGTAHVVDLEGGQLVGAISEPRFTGAGIDLAPGDTLLLHTDGLTEARTSTSQERTRYDEDDLLEFVRSLAPASASTTVDAIAALLDSFGDGLDDDTALLAIGRPSLSPRTCAGHDG
jgi:sigma-B regulation protein RsbU (phosphoserine phosphatase)